MPIYISCTQAFRFSERGIQSLLFDSLGSLLFLSFSSRGPYSVTSLRVSYGCQYDVRVACNIHLACDYDALLRGCKVSVAHHRSIAYM